jgi:hypothetical protein
MAGIDLHVSPLILATAKVLVGRCGNDNDNDVAGNNGDSKTTRMAMTAAAGVTKQQPTT